MRLMARFHEKSDLAIVLELWRWKDGVGYPDTGLVARSGAPARAHVILRVSTVQIVLRTCGPTAAPSWSDRGRAVDAFLAKPDFLGDFFAFAQPHEMIAPPCVPSLLRGEWYFRLGPSLPTTGTFPDCTRANQSFHELLNIELASAPSNYAALLGVHGSGRAAGLADIAVGTWTVNGAESAFEVIVGDRVLYASLAAPDCNASSTGVWRDRSGEQWGCFEARRRAGGGLFCPPGSECHGGAAFKVGPTRTPTKVRLGSRSLPAAVLVPQLIESPPAPPAPTLVRNATALAAAVNEAGQLWRASDDHPALATLRSLLGEGASAAPPLRSWAAAEGAEERATDGRAAWPSSLDWRTHRGGGWLSAPVDLLGHALPAAAGCAAAGHVAAVLATVEARVRIASNRTQDEKGGLSLEAALGCSPYAFGCASPASGFLVGKLGVEFGFEKRSCVPAASAAAMVLGAAKGVRPAAAEGVREGGGVEDVAPAASDETPTTIRFPCSALARCPSPLRRRARAARWAGGHYGAGSEAALLKELQSGPIAVGLALEPEFALYSSGVYHALERDVWKRRLGKTLPAYDPSRCHSGCAPPEALEWQATNYAALLVGYGVEEPSDDDADDAPPRPYWTLQLPWGSSWGEGGYARVLRGEAAVESAALVVEPMV